MVHPTDLFDLGRLSLSSGEGRRIDVVVKVDGFEFGGQDYVLDGGSVQAVLGAARTSGSGYSLRLRFGAKLEGPCVRCLETADQTVEVDAREVDQPGAGDDLRSPYVEDDDLDIKSWARDALALALPAQIVCGEDCQGLCAICGENLNTAGPEHQHESEPDPRWAKLSELNLD
jgi:uncharacterized protein